MNLLKITNGKGEFSLDSKSYKPIDEITKEDIFHMIELILLEDNIDFEENTEIKKIDNLAQSIIYSNLLNKLKEVKNRKQSIIDDSKNDFSESIIKYSKESQQ